LLWLALLILPLLFLGARRLMALARWRRRTALFLQTLSVLLLVVAVAEPARALPNNDLNVVVVLDNSASLSKESRDQASTYAQGILQSASPTDHLSFVSTAAEATLLTNEEVADGTSATDDSTQNSKFKIQNSE
jgi:hypothetical protein